MADPMRIQEWWTGPELVKADEQDGISTSLGIKVNWATPYHGQVKPIERAFTRTVPPKKIKTPCLEPCKILQAIVRLSA